LARDGRYVFLPVCSPLAMNSRPHQAHREILHRTDTDRRRQTEFGQAHVRVRDQTTCEVMNVSRKEQKAFWQWAMTSSPQPLLF
jgi:hypothetical protein